MLPAPTPKRPNFSAPAEAGAYSCIYVAVRYPGMKATTRITCLFVAIFVTLITMSAQKRTGTATEWLYPAGDPGAMHYSALNQINRSNVGQLKAAWSWKTGEEPIAGTVAGTF